MFRVLPILIQGIFCNKLIANIVSILNESVTNITFVLFTNLSISNIIHSLPNILLKANLPYENNTDIKLFALKKDTTTNLNTQKAAFHLKINII